MTEQQEVAMRQALEALELIIGDIEWQEFSPTRKFCRKAITALRQALEQQPAEKPQPPHCMVGGLIKDNAMCGHVIQMKFCGYGGPCQYKGEQQPAVSDERTNDEPVAHWSDCAVHSEPAYPSGECDCGGYFPEKNAQTLLKEIAHIVRTKHLYGPEMAKLLEQESKMREKNGGLK